MRKNLVSSIVAASLLLGSTAALAETRPQATRFSQPVGGKDNDAQPLSFSSLLLIGGGSILGIWGLVEAFRSNSPNVPNIPS